MLYKYTTFLICVNNTARLFYFSQLHTYVFSKIDTLIIYTNIIKRSFNDRKMFFAMFPKNICMKLLFVILFFLSGTNYSAIFTRGRLEQTIKPSNHVLTTEVDSVIAKNTGPISKFIKSLGEKERWRIKTNLPPWGIFVPNLSAEYQLTNSWSIELPVYYNPVTLNREFRFRIFALQPSLRYWLQPEMKGHFFGVHLVAGTFNISTNSKNRYQDTGGMYGLGMDYGYTQYFSEHWDMEFNIGAGLIHTKYNTYYNIKNGIRYSTDIKNYWGITKCNISIIYKFK